MEKCSIQIIIQRDAKNEPFAKVLYNGQDAFNLDDNMKFFAGYLARKSVVSGIEDKGLVFISTETGDVLEVNQIDRLTDQEYCISGCESGKQHIKNLIRTICCGANNLDIKSPVFVTDGKVAPIFINERDLSGNYNRLSLELEKQKYQLLDSLLEKPNVSQAFNKKI